MLRVDFCQLEAGNGVEIDRLCVSAVRRIYQVLGAI